MVSIHIITFPLNIWLKIKNYSRSYYLSATSSALQWALDTSTTHREFLPVEKTPKSSLKQSWSSNSGSKLLQQLDIMLRWYSRNTDSPGDIVWHCGLVDNCTQQTNTSAHYLMTVVSSYICCDTVSVTREWTRCEVSNLITSNGLYERLTRHQPLPPTLSVATQNHVGVNIHCSNAVMF